MAIHIAVLQLQMKGQGQAYRVYKEVARKKQELESKPELLTVMPWYLQPLGASVFSSASRR